MNQATDSERKLAALAHATGVFFPVLGPVAVLALVHRSRFVRFHALHALVGTLLLDGFLLLMGTICLTFSLIGFYSQYQEGFQNFNLWQMLLKSAVTWLVFALIGLGNTILNVVQAVRAYRGEMPARGITSSLVRRFSGEHRQLA